MKTSELIGAALDWAVAHAAGVPVSLNYTLFSENPLERDPWDAANYPERKCVYRTDEDQELEEAGDSNFCTYLRPDYSPSTDWSQGGPIIEREMINVNASVEGDWSAFYVEDFDMVGIKIGPTPLIAAMRCYVASKLGDEIEIPEELI